MIALSLGLMAISLGIALHFSGVTRFQAQGRRLAENILLNSYNPWNQTLTSYSLNAVSAVIWDVRAIDTILETIVLFASIIGVSVLMENKAEAATTVSKSPVTRVTTRLVLILTMLIALSTAIHGHISPGGGFQSGVMMTSMLVLAIPVLGLHLYLYSRRERLLVARLVLLGVIMTTALISVIYFIITGEYGYVLQNQARPSSSFSIPAWFIDSPTGGSILLYNLFESFTVFIALAYSIILISVSMGISRHGESRADRD